MVASQASGSRTQAVIVGAGPAGDAVAAGLRDAGYEGEIKLVGAETGPPYERPHLSKGYIAGTVPPERLALRPVHQYGELGVELMLGSRVVDLDLEARKVVLESGATLAWDRLCLATGSDAKALTSLPDAMHLREVPDAERVRALIAGREAVDIIGAGFIGCEVAAVAVQQGCAVTVYERSPEPLSLVLGPELGGYLADVHVAHGVDLHLGRSSLPRLDKHPLVAIGSVPRTGLAERAGLLVDGGIVVDKLGRTSAPDVFAAGDATRFFSPLFGTHIRVEHFQGAQRQGFTVGRSMAGATEPYAEAPWFWSEQYDLNIQFVGAVLAHDEVVVRGEVGRPPFTVFRLRSGELVSAIGFNDHHTVARTRRVMEARRSVTPQHLANPSFDLRRALA